VWIDLPEFSASVVAHNSRPDLLVIRFRTATECELCVRQLEQYTMMNDLDQRRAYIFGTTPGICDYPYRIYVRRTYFSILIFNQIQSMRYHNFKDEAHSKGPKGLLGMLREGYLFRKWSEGREYGEQVYKRVENYKTASTPRPVYTPRTFEEIGREEDHAATN